MGIIDHCYFDTEVTVPDSSTWALEVSENPGGGWSSWQTITLTPGVKSSLTQDLLSDAAGKMTDEALLANVYNIHFDASLNRIVLRNVGDGDIYPFKIRFQSGLFGQAALAEVLGFETADRVAEYEAAADGAFYSLEAPFHPQYVFSPQAGLSEELCENRAHTIVTKDWSGAAVTETSQSSRRRRLYTLFPVRRYFIFAETATPDGVTDSRNCSLEDFWNWARAGKQINFFDHRRVYSQNVVLGAGSNSSQSILTLPQTPANDLLTGVDIIGLDGAGKGQRRRVEENLGQTAAVETDWDGDGQLPAEGSIVGIFQPMQSGVFDEPTGRELPIERAETDAEFYTVTIGLLIG